MSDISGPVDVNPLESGEHLSTKALSNPLANPDVAAEDTTIPDGEDKESSARDVGGSEVREQEEPAKTSQDGNAESGASTSTPLVDIKSLGTGLLISSAAVWLAYPFIPREAMSVQKKILTLGAVSVNCLLTGLLCKMDDPVADLGLGKKVPKKLRESDLREDKSLAQMHSFRANAGVTFASPDDRTSLHETGKLVEEFSMGESLHASLKKAMAETGQKYVVLSLGAGEGRIEERWRKAYPDMNIVATDIISNRIYIGGEESETPRATDGENNAPAAPLVYRLDARKLSDCANFMAHLVAEYKLNSPSQVVLFNAWGDNPSEPLMWFGQALVNFMALGCTKVMAVSYLYECGASLSYNGVMIDSHLYGDRSLSDMAESRTNISVGRTDYASFFKLPEDVQYVAGSEFVREAPERLLCKMAGNSLPHVIAHGQHAHREEEELEELYESIRDPNKMSSDTYDRLRKLATEPHALANHIRGNLPFRYLEYWVLSSLIDEEGKPITIYQPPVAQTGLKPMGTGL